MKTETETEAVAAARAYAAEYDVPWAGVSRVRRIRTWWWFRILAYRFDIDTGGHGTAWATVGTSGGGVLFFEFWPSDAGRFRLPPWAAYPLYNSATIWWRMGSGEHYLVEWGRWFRSLPCERQAAYQARFPPPDRDGWADFYGLRAYLR